MKNVAIVTAGGVGLRFSGEVKKQFLEIKGKPLLVWTIEKFINHPDIDSIVVTAPEDSVNHTGALLKTHFPNTDMKVIVGGVTRQDSVYNALASLDIETDIVLIHDGVRPLITSTEISLLIKMAEEYRAVIPAHKVKNTIKVVEDDKVVKTVDRDKLYEVYTPQVFAYPLILDCHKKAKEDSVIFTDDAAILEHYGHPVHIVETSPYNIKLTERVDFEVMELLIESNNY